MPMLACKGSKMIGKMGPPTAAKLPTLRWPVTVHEPGSDSFFAERADGYGQTTTPEKCA